MIPSLSLQHVNSFSTMPDEERAGLLATARALRRAQGGGGPPPPLLLLKGKHLGLLSEQPDSDDARRFLAAAGALGATVACIRPSVAGVLDASHAAHTARMLGRLYDGIECQGLPAPQLALIRDAAQVPVYDGIAAAGHPSTALAGQLDGDGDSDPELDRRCLLQAMLIGTIGL